MTIQTEIEMNEELQTPVIVCGYKNVGKTSILRRYLCDSFLEESSVCFYLNKYFSMNKKGINE